MDHRKLMHRVSRPSWVANGQQQEVERVSSINEVFRHGGWQFAVVKEFLREEKNVVKISFYQ